MSNPSLIFIADSMYQEMEYVRKHFDDFGIAELEYALRILEGEANQLACYISEASGQNYYLIDAYTAWEDFNEEMADKFQTVRICIA